MILNLKFTVIYLENNFMVITIFLDNDKFGGVDTHLQTLLDHWPNNQDKFILLHNRNNIGIELFKKALPKKNDISFISYRKYFLLEYFRKIPFLFFFIFIIDVLHNLLLICYYIKKSNVFVSNNGGYPASFKALAFIIATYIANKKKRVLIIHHAAKVKNEIFPFFLNLINKCVTFCSTDIIAVSFATRHTLIERQSFNTMLKPIRVIHNAVNLENINDFDKNFLRNQYNIPKEKIILGILSRIENYKGHEDLIIAYSRLSINIRNEYVIFFVGSGDDTEINRLKNLINNLNLKQDFIFTGFMSISPTEIVSNFNLLLMLTKDFEAYNYTIAEAMKMGIPTLITNVGAITEFYDNSLTTIINPESPYEIKDFLEDFIKNKLKYQIIAKSAKHNIQKHNPLIMAKSYYDIFII
jgi:glycosyltransferase involved in cell wall biosynthesis